MARVASLVTIGVLAAGLGAAEQAMVRMTLHGISPDYDLDIAGLGEFDGSWDLGLRAGVEFIGVIDHFGGMDLAMGVGLSGNWAQEDDIDGSFIDTRLLGIGGRYYVGVAGGERFGYEVLPYIGVGIQELSLKTGGNRVVSDVDYMWDLGCVFNLTTSFGEHWLVGLSGGAFYRTGSFDSEFSGDTEMAFEQIGFEYGLLTGIRF